MYPRTYCAHVEHNGGLGGGNGGITTTELYYESTHRAKSAANLEDARFAFRRKYGRAGTIEVLADTCVLVRE